MSFNACYFASLADATVVKFIIAETCGPITVTEPYDIHGDFTL